MSLEQSRILLLDGARIPEICPICKGKKKVNESRVIGNRVVTIKANCSWCDGKGYTKVLPQVYIRR